jgi:hypothetical protein
MTDEDESIQKKPAKIYRHADVFEEVLGAHSDKRHICKLIRLMICYSTNSAGPERGFSLQNRIKDKRRNRMCDLTLNDIMHIVSNQVPQTETDYMKVAKSVNCALPPVF